MENAQPPATPTSSAFGPQMPVREASSCGCHALADIFRAEVVQHICVTDDTAEVQQVVRMHWTTFQSVHWPACQSVRPRYKK